MIGNSYGGMNSLSSMYAIASMNVEAFRVQQTGTYNQQYLRPFTANPTGEVVSAIVDDAVKYGKLTPANFTGMAADFIRPTAAPEAPIELINGWNERRLRFFLVVRTVDTLGNKNRIIVTGYSEHSDLSLSNQWDPQMKFYINNIMTVQDMTVDTPLGVQAWNRVLDNSQILTNQNYSGFQGVNQPITLTPENVFNAWENVSEGLTNSSFPTSNGSFMKDSRYDLTGRPIKNSRVNTIAPQYLSTILNTYLNAVPQDDHATQQDILMSCAKLTRSPSVEQDPFLKFLIERRSQAFGQYAVNFDRSFTMNDLMFLDANTPNVTHFEPRVEGLHTVGTTANWGDGALLTQMAAALSQSVPSYMSALGIGFIRFRSTNMFVTSPGIQTLIEQINGFYAGAGQTEINTFEHVMSNQFLLGLCFNNQMPFDLSISVDIFGETVIDLSINGQASVRYVAPTFADALFTPMVTTQSYYLNNIAESMNDLSQLIHENTAVKNQSSSNNNGGLGGMDFGSPGDPFRV